MKFITAIDPDDSKPDILKPRTIAYMTEKDKRKFPIGWMKTTESDDWSRTGSLSGSSALLKRQHDGYSWVFITRKISAMMKQAMSKVRQWPDRDLFSVERQQPSGPQPDTVRLTHTARTKIASPHPRSGSRPPI